MDFETNILKLSEESGAFRSYIIDVDKIPFDKELRKYCAMNYCGFYGKNYACPPEVGEPDEVIEKAKSFKRALIFQTVTDLEDSYDFEGMEEAAKNHTKLSNQLNKEFKNNVDVYLQLTVGACTVCEDCSIKEGLPCRLPDLAISSLEAYCMNVSTLAELCDMKYINGQNTVTYFGAFLF